MNELKNCPINGMNCKPSECMWWCDFGNDCAVSLLAEMFADSNICNNIFK